MTLYSKYSIPLLSAILMKQHQLNHNFSVSIQIFAHEYSLSLWFMLSLFTNYDNIYQEYHKCYKVECRANETTPKYSHSHSSYHGAWPWNYLQDLNNRSNTEGHSTYNLPKSYPRVFYVLVMFRALAQCA